MLKKYQDISEVFHNGEQKFTTNLDEFSDAVEEIKNNATKRLDDYKNINIIISDIDKQFSEKTGIMNPKDQAFLWFAVAIQCVRWILIPTFDEETLTPDKEDRKDSNSEGKKDKTATNKELDNNKEEYDSQKYPSRDAIIKLPVPYDAMEGTEDIVIPGVTEFGVNICGINHHAATLGHDPIIGQVIGTANIMTRSITFHDKNTTTRKVELISGRTQKVVKIPEYSKIQMFSDVVSSSGEDIGRIWAAVKKENLHLASDKLTRMGLPIPLLSAALQQEYLSAGWNSKELEDVIKSGIKGTAKNFAVAYIINTIVGILHGMCYNEQKDESKSLYSVRTRKIVATSNVIAECINIAAVAGGAIAGSITDNEDLIKKSVSHLDIGGIIEAIHRVYSSKKLQEKVRQEFLEQSLFEKFTSNKYSFLEESYYG